MRAAALVAWALASASCAHLGDGDPRLEGHWRGVRAEGIAAEGTAIANAFALGTELDVRGDVLSVTAAGQRQTGRYRVMHADASHVAIVGDLDAPSDPQTFTFSDEDTMKWAVLPGKTIVLSRE